MSLSNIQVPMERRIVSALQAGDSATQEEKELLEAFLREHFFREYYSPLPFHALKQHFQMKEYAAGETIFQQGEEVTEYCLLVLGRVMVTRRERMQQEERCLLDGPSLLGQCVELRQSKRQSTARVVSLEAVVLTIPSQAIQTLLVNQIAELDFILSEIAAFAGTTAEGLDRVRLAPLVKLEKYRLKQVIRTKPEVAYLIVQGECRVSSRRREAVVSRPNCLAIAAYFQKTEEECTYTAQSTELHLVAMSYSAFPLLPPSFIENLSFLHQAHRHALQEAPLPRLERNTTNPSLHERPPHCTHKAKKSSSMAELDTAIEDVQCLRRHFVLGFYSQQAAASAQDYGRRRQKEPKGYFDLKVRAENGEGEQQMRRREWASYLKARSEEKAKVKETKGNLKPRKENTPTLSPRQNNLADLFSRYHNLPSLPHKKHAHLAKAGKLKQYVFKQAK